MTEQLLTVTEAARLLAVKPSTLYTWAYERRLPTVKLGRALRFRLADVEAFIKANARPALRTTATE